MFVLWQINLSRQHLFFYIPGAPFAISQTIPACTYDKPVGFIFVWFQGWWTMIQQILIVGHLSGFE